MQLDYMRTFPIKVHYKLIEILAVRWLRTKLTQINQREYTTSDVTALCTCVCMLVCLLGLTTYCKFQMSAFKYFTQVDIACEGQ